MKKAFMTLSLMLWVLSSCQTVPAERKNNCACVWQEPAGLINLMEGARV